MLKRSRLFALGVITALLLAACSSAAPATPSAEAPANATQSSAATTAAQSDGTPSDVTPAASTEKVELSFWTEWSAQPQLGAVEELVKQFNDTHPNIHIIHRAIENEAFFTTLRTGFTAGNPPDIFQHEGHGNLFQFVKPGEVEDISDWWQPRSDRFQAGTDASIMYEGKYYGVPWTLHTDHQMYYNETVLTAHGIDGKALKTWDDYLASFEKLKSAGVIPLAFANKFGWSGSQFFNALLVRMVGAEQVWALAARKCEYKWTDPEIVQAAKLYTDLSDKGYFSSGKASDDFAGAEALFFGGKAGFFHTGSWLVSGLDENAAPDFKLGMNIFPTVPGATGDPKNIVMQALDGISISKKGAEKHREEALIFLDWMTEQQQAHFWALKTIQISPINGAMSDDANPFLVRIVNEEIEGNTGSIPFVEHIVPKTVGEEAVWMGSVGVLTGQLTAESWMQSVEAEAANQAPIIDREATCK